MDSNSALNMIRNRTSAALRCPLCRQEWNVFVRVPILSTMIDELKKFKNMNKLEKLRESFKAAANALLKQLNQMRVQWLSLFCNLCNILYCHYTLFSQHNLLTFCIIHIY